MTFLRVHDLQQNLAHQFVHMAKTSIAKGKLDATKKECLFIKGQEMGFCNDDIKILLEDIIPGV